MQSNSLRVMQDRQAQAVPSQQSESDALAWAYNELSLIYGGTSHALTQQLLAKLNLMAQVAA